MDIVGIDKITTFSINDLLLALRLPVASLLHFPPLFMISLSRLSRFSRFLHPPFPVFTLSTAAATPASSTSTPSSSTTPPPTESRWRRLKRERRQRPRPSNRIPSFDSKVSYPLPTALQHVRASRWANFDESLELIFRLNIDPRRAIENIRGVYQLPNGSGRLIRVAAFADGDAVKEAKEAGADLVGGDELIDLLRQGKARAVKGFSACVSMPHFLPVTASKLGKLLGPKGLLPSVKDGTVGNDVAELVRRVKEGQTRFRTDKAGNVHMIVGKLSFGDDMLVQNTHAATMAILEARPSSVKKKYMKRAVLCSSMGPGVELDIQALVEEVMTQTV